MTDTAEVHHAGFELNQIDIHFSRLLERIGQVKDTALTRVFAELSHSLRRQHSCLDLARHDDGPALLKKLARLSIVGNGDTNTPLVLDGDRLFMQRYYRYEVRVARWLAEHNRALPDHPSPDVIATQLNALFGDEPSRQKLAACQALTRGLTIITGGPGTGKTSTVVKMIEAIQSSEPAISIRLAAPTGKATMRLAEAVADVAQPRRLTVQTLHRLLGMRADGRTFRHNPDNPLPVDLLIVDEVSMIDLAMMHRLLAALPRTTRLILLGDPDQLPSVEAGNILADICRYPAGYSPVFSALALTATGLDLPTTETKHHLRDAVCQFDLSYRFAPDRGIGRLSDAIRRGGATPFGDDAEVMMRSPQASEPADLFAVYNDYWQALQQHAPADALLKIFDQVRILGPLRDGDQGIVAINAAIEAELSDRGLIGTGQTFYHGRPILITRNDYNLRLFNGDVGICVLQANLEPRVVFADSSGQPREYLASRLPAFETCFAMTVHKAQGSEFDHVVLVLPTEVSVQARQVMTRELLYTGVTRARRQLTVIADAATLASCIKNRNFRQSGLGDRLLESPPQEPKPVSAPDQQGRPPDQLELF